MFHKVAKISPADDLCLLVDFVTGERKKYDVKQLFEKFEQFRALTAPGLFKCVAVDVGGFGIYWNDELDLSCDELWHNGTPITA